MLIWSGEFTSSAPLTLWFDERVLVAENPDDPEAPENTWVLATTGRIDAPNFAGETATVTVTSGGTYVELQGLNASNQVTLDSSGKASFSIATTGTAANVGNVRIQVSVNPTDSGEVEVVESSLGVHVKDFFAGVIGLDTEEGSGIVGGIAGGYLIIGDVGAIIKNTVRNYGWSDVEPNNFELVLAAAGLIGTFSGPGDGVITAIRQLVQRLGNSPLTDVLWQMAKRIMADGKLPTEAEQNLIFLIRDNDALQDAAGRALS